MVMLGAKVLSRSYNKLFRELVQVLFSRKGTLKSLTGAPCGAAVRGNLRKEEGLSRMISVGMREKRKKNFRKTSKEGGNPAIK